jgi:hypothetical protein
MIGLKTPFATLMDKAKYDNAPILCFQMFSYWFMFLMFMNRVESGVWFYCIIDFIADVKLHLE